MKLTRNTAPARGQAKENRRSKALKAAELLVERFDDEATVKKLSYREIANYLNLRGLKTIRGNLWNKSAAQKLKNRNDFLQLVGSARLMRSSPKIDPFQNFYSPAKR